MTTRCLSSALLISVFGLAVAPVAHASDTIRKTVVPSQNEINQAVALVTCKADRPAFRDLAYEVREVKSSGEPAAGWQAIPVAEIDSMALGYLFGVVAEMQLPAPVYVFGHPTTRLILKRGSIVAVFDDPTLAGQLSDALSLDRIRGGGSGKIRVIQSKPEEVGDGVELIALAVDSVEAIPAPLTLAGCLYMTL